jgi:hypothetical protein
LSRSVYQDELPVEWQRIRARANTHKQETRDIVEVAVGVVVALRLSAS